MVEQHMFSHGVNIPLLKPYAIVAPEHVKNSIYFVAWRHLNRSPYYKYDSGPHSLAPSTWKF